MRRDFAALTHEVHEEGRSEGDMSAASRWSTHWRQRLSTSLWKGNVCAVIARCRRDRVVAGRAVRGTRPTHMMFDTDEP